MYEKLEMFDEMMLVFFSFWLNIVLGIAIGIIFSCYFRRKILTKEVIFVNFISRRIDLDEKSFEAFDYILLSRLTTLKNHSTCFDHNRS